MAYPKLSYIKSMLEFAFPELEAIIQDAFVVGSFARGTQGPESDLDVALIVTQPDLETLLNELDILDLDTLNVELLNMRSDTDWKWEDRPLDLQVFTDQDPRLRGYAKIKLKASSQARLG